jgi:hypothetical protein
MCRQYCCVSFLPTFNPVCIQRGIAHLEPIIEDRRGKEEEYGGLDWPGNPAGYVSH